MRETQAALFEGRIRTASRVELALLRVRSTESCTPDHDEAIFALGRLGAPAVEPLLAAYETADADLRVSFAEALSLCRVRDERILRTLVEMLDQDAFFGALFLAR